MSQVDWRGFLGGYQVTCSADWFSDDAEERQQLAQIMLQHQSDLYHVFSSMDYDGNGQCTLDECEWGLMVLADLEPNFTLTPEQARRIAERLDTSGDGSVSWDEFVAGFGGRWDGEAW